MPKQTVCATIDGALLKKIKILCEQAERTQSWFINKAIEGYLEELEDLKTAKERLDDKRLTPSQIRKAIGVHH